MATISETGAAALRTVLDHHEAEEVIALRRELQELRQVRQDAAEACPALFASVGDLFTHRRHDNMGDEMEDEVFVYQGRTLGSGKAPAVTPAGRLIFKWVAGSWGIEEGYGAINRGVRDVIDAWPQRDYRVYDDEGRFEPGVFCLPPSMCYCFRAFEEPDDDDDDEADYEEEEEEATDLSRRCVEACYHAAFCGRGPPGSTHWSPDASDLNFQGVLDYLSSSPPIDYILPPEHSQGVHSMLSGVHYSPLLKAAVAAEWDNLESRKDVAKRAIFEMVLLAGAAFDGPVGDTIRTFAGTAMTEAGGGVQYMGEYACSVLDKCTALPAARRARWPEVLGEISAAAARAEQYAVVRRRFLEICCEGKVDEATLEGLHSC